MRFTPAASNIINLIAADIGRPVAHIATNLVGYHSLEADVRQVLDTLAPREVPVQTIEGKTYTMRVQPNRTLENVIEGAVISFVDITEMVAAREALREVNDQLRLAAVVRDAAPPPRGSKRDPKARRSVPVASHAAVAGDARTGRLRPTERSVSSPALWASETMMFATSRRT